MSPTYSSHCGIPSARSVTDGTSGSHDAEGWVDDRGQDAVLPPAVDQKAGRCAPFDVEAAALEHGRAPQVAGHVVGGDPVQPPLLECESDSATYRFCHVPIALLVPRQVVTEHTRLRGAAMHLGQIEVADDPGGCRPIEQERPKGFAGAELTRTHPHLLLPHRLVEEIRREGWRVRLKVVAVVAVVLDDLVDVGGLRKPHCQSLGFDQPG